MRIDKFLCSALVVLVSGCATGVVNQEKAESMSMVELCSSLCSLSAFTDQPLQPGQVCNIPNQFVVDELIARFPYLSLTSDELLGLRGIMIDDAAEMLITKGVSECAFVALMGLPTGQGSFSSSDTSSSYHVYPSFSGRHAYFFFAESHLDRKKLYSGEAVESASRSEADHFQMQRADSVKDVYLNGVRIPRNECIGAVVMGECQGTAIMPDRPGRKKCYGSIVGGRCVGAEF